MASFINAMNAHPLTTQGVKGSDVYTKEGVGDDRVALFQLLVRNVSATDVEAAVHKAFKNPSASTETLQDYPVMAFQTRDIRGGKGERDVFYTMLLAIFREAPSTIDDLIRLIPEYGCWVDAWKLYQKAKSHDYESQIRASIRNYAKATYFEDLKKAEMSQSVSLLGKWLPREKSKFHDVAVVLSDAFHPEIVKSEGRRRQYRKNCAHLNTVLKTTEVDMCGRTWAKIDPAHVPGRLITKNRKAFLNEIVERKGKPSGRRLPATGLRHPENEDRMACRQHFLDHTEKALKGEVKMKGADVVYPHELVAKYMGDYGSSHISKDEESILQAQWNAIRDKAAEEAVGLKACVPMCDFSGSMSGIPMEVSMALGLLLSEINHYAFQGYMIGFDSTPSWIDLTNCKTLKEKVQHARGYAQGMSTDFQAACDLILRRLVEYRVPASEAPKDLIVFTDMGFDQASHNSYAGLYTGNRYTHNVKKQPWETQIQMIRRNFTDHGYAAPRIVLWNLRADYKDFHARADEEGVVVLSGWSPAVLKAISKNGVDVQTPYMGMRELLDDARYDAVRAAWVKRRE